MLLGVHVTWFFYDLCEDAPIDLRINGTRMASRDLWLVAVACSGRVAGRHELSSRYRIPTACKLHALSRLFPLKATFRFQRGYKNSFFCFFFVGSTDGFSAGRDIEFAKHLSSVPNPSLPRSTNLKTNLTVFSFRFFIFFWGLVSSLYQWLWWPFRALNRFPWTCSNIFIPSFYKSYPLSSSLAWANVVLCA